MKYIYYYIWVILAFLHYRISKVLFAINKIFFKMRKTGDDEQNRWKEDYNKGFLGFPGGMLDWAAFGVLLIFVFSIIFILLISFDLETELLKSKTNMVILLIVLTAIIYYLVYFKNMAWLKDKIGRINKKYYL